MNTPESDILAVALTRYADACPPTLHSDCPFAVADATGRTCHQQCRDEVIRLQRPGHSSLSVFSGTQFDARQILLSETGRVPEAQWHTASLMLRLDLALRVPPCSADGTYFLLREIDITNALAYLGQRGIDPDWLVRFGLRASLPWRIAVWVGEHYLLGPDHEGDATGGWLEIAASFMDGATFDDLGPWLASAHRSGFSGYIEKWLEQAPLENIWAWRPWDIDVDLVVANDDRAVWVFDRFRRTYLSEWAETSLHQEFRYLRGDVHAPIPTSEMKKRDVSIATLTAEISDRAVKTSRSHAAEVMSQALQFLDEGRRREAAALFDAARIVEPSDASAHNNHGFCLTPDVPGEALEALRRAEQLESAVEPVNRINQAVALRLLGRPEEALAVAEYAFHNADLFDRLAWLWKDPHDPETAEPVAVDPYAYLIDLGRALAAEVGDEASAKLWANRVSDRSLGGE